MNRAALVISLVAVFLTGVSLGLLGGVLVVHRMPFGPPVPFARHDRGPGMGPGMRPPIARMLPRLARALDLTPEQVRRIEARVQVSQRQFQAARESLSSRIEAELTPEQRVRWREMQRRHERPMEFPGEPRGPGGRMGPAAPPDPEGEPR